MIQTVGTVASYVANGGVILKCSAGIYGFPVVIWGLGASEGAIRTAFNGLAFAFDKTTGYDREANERWERFKRDGSITISCVIFTGISLVPVIGTCIGDYNIGVQCHRYQKLKKAHQRALKAEAREGVNKVITQLHQVPEIDEKTLTELSHHILHPEKHSGPIVLLAEDRNLPKSLIYQYYGYSAAYIAAEKTCHGIHVTAVTLKDLAVHMFKYGFVRRMAETVFLGTVIEVSQTMNDAALNRRPHQLFSKQQPKEN